MSSCLQTRGSYHLRGIRLGRELAETREQCVERERRLLSPALAHRERVVGLAVAVHDHERHLLELGVADPLAERVVAVVDLDADTPPRRGARGAPSQPSRCPSPTGITRTCTGASQNGNAPP